MRSLRVKQSGVLLAGLFFALSAVAPAEAEPRAMAASEIMALARPAEGHGYHWSAGNWTMDGTQIGKCTKKAGSNGCPGCDFSGSVGTDCSGFVAKSWQVPESNPVDYNVHPYGTPTFYSVNGGRVDGLAWEKIDDKSTAQRADAFVYSNVWDCPTADEPDKKCRSGHIVLVDHRGGSDNQPYAIHASSCDNGVITGTVNVEPVVTGPASGLKPWILIRRDKVTQVACGPSNCYQGTCSNDGTCHCKENIVGDNCDRCADGYARYPNCVKFPEQIAGELECNRSYDFYLDSGFNTFEDYGCGLGPMAGTELSYLFRPKGEGKATVTINSDPDVAVILLRNEMDPDQACERYSSSELQFDYGGYDQFFLVVDQETDTGDIGRSISLDVNCEWDRQPWIGDPCTTNADCDYTQITPAGARTDGVCYKQGSASFCSLPCEGSCPDAASAASTACIADPADTSKGICVSQSDSLNQNCSDIAGTESAEANRFGKTTKVTVCQPIVDPSACEASIRGSVVDASSGAPVVSAKALPDGATESLVSGEDGTFSGGALGCGVQQVDVEADGYLPTTIDVNVGSYGAAIDLPQLGAVSELCPGVVPVSGQVIDGVSNSAIPGAALELREGLSNLTGDLAGAVDSDETGAYQLPDLAAGVYTLTASSPGYGSAIKFLSVCDGALGDENLYLTPQSDSLLRFVLTWERPGDMDLHLMLPNGQSIFFDEACKGSLDASPYAQLDVDHYEANGPETISVRSLLPGRYELFVHNYDGQNSGAVEQLRDSGAAVVVYGASGEELERLAVPATGSGYFWDVLSFEVGSDGSPAITVLGNVNNTRPNPFDEYAGVCNAN